MKGKKRRRKRKKWLWFLFILIIAGGLGSAYYFQYVKKEVPATSNKSAMAYLEYMGSYMTFDEDGFVLQSYTEPPEHIPLVMGLNFDYVIVNEYLPVENEELFRLCIYISESLTDAEIVIDRIHLSEEEEIFLYLGDVTIEMGKKKELEKKLVHLKNLSANLKNYSAGVLDMTIYSEKGEYTFTTKK
jgi:cell division protein FtsQ